MALRQTSRPQARSQEIVKIAFESHLQMPPKNSYLSLPGGNLITSGVQATQIKAPLTIILNLKTAHPLTACSNRAPQRLPSTTNRFFGRLYEQRKFLLSTSVSG